jgi:hypothetical protein
VNSAATAPPTRVLAEVPIAALDGNGAETIIRIVVAYPQAVAPAARTRATP